MCIDFSVGYDAIDISNILNIHKYLMNEIIYKCLDLLKNMFIIFITIQNV